MTFTVAPNVIEQSDFSGGWNPDQEVVTSDPNTLRDMLNLLPELGGTGALVTRKGFKRIMEELGGALTSHWAVSIHPFKGNSTSYLIVVMTDGTSNANNVRLYAVNMGTLAVSRIDTAGVTWDNPYSHHWGIGVDEVYYGGSRGNAMYSWTPTGPTWDADASTDATWKTLVDKSMSDSIGATERARDFAWRGKEIVTYSGDQYMPGESIRYDDWESDANSRYKRGDRVTRKTTWSGSSSYPISWECIKAHTADTAAAYPGTGADWKDYWKKVRLPLPLNSDGETSSKWYFVPVAAETCVATWHADRLWMRYDGQGDKSRVLYSAPVKPEKGEDVPDTTWDPTDFAPGNDLRGPGGGWIPFNDGKKDGVVEALHSYGQYLLVFKRQAVWVLTGNSEDSFTRRRLASHVGAVGPEAVVELDGLVYFLSDDGLYVTDGTTVEPVRGFEKFANTIEARLDLMHAHAKDIRPTLVAYDDRIWMNLPLDTAAAGSKWWTLVYEPRTGGIFKTDLPISTMVTARHSGVPCLYFCPPDTYGTNNDYVHQYDHSGAAGLDDDGTGTYNGAAFSWQATTAWWPFGLTRQQRRIRRVWAVVKGALTYTITRYRDWSTSDTSNVSRTVSATTPTFIEGEWFPDSHAVSFKLSSTASGAVVYGIGVDTQPRRARYHVT